MRLAIATGSVEASTPMGLLQSGFTELLRDVSALDLRQGTAFLELDTVAFQETTGICEPAQAPWKVAAERAGSSRSTIQLRSSPSGAFGFILPVNPINGVGFEIRTDSLPNGGKKPLFSKL